MVGPALNIRDTVTFERFEKVKLVDRKDRGCDRNQNGQDIFNALHTKPPASAKVKLWRPNNRS
jgi:hypothetical protein